MYTKIKEIRTIKGMKQTELAELLNTTQSNVARYERGDREPSLEMIVKIADIFSVSTDYLLGLTDNKINKKELTSDDRHTMKTRFKEARELTGMTQTEFAEKLGKSVRAVQTWEQGIREASYETLVSIEDICGVTTDFILGRTDITSNKKELTSSERKQALAIGEAAPTSPEHLAVENNQELMQAIESIVRKVLTEQQLNAQY